LVRLEHFRPVRLNLAEVLVQFARIHATLGADAGNDPALNRAEFDHHRGLVFAMERFRFSRNSWPLAPYVAGEEIVSRRAIAISSRSNAWAASP
jgi:hypothetical protein